MAMVASTSFAYHKPRFAVVRRKNEDGRERGREKEHKHPFKVVEITPPPRCLGVRCFPTVKLEDFDPLNPAEQALATQPPRVKTWPS